MEEVARGNRLDPTNVFRWDQVWLNLPGAMPYDPTKPWVSKIRTEDGRIAADMVTFVDDVRPSGPSKREAWQAGQRVAKTLSYLGMQDAPRKNRDSSQRPGAWSGGVVHSDDPQVWVLVSEDK